MTEKLLVVPAAPEPNDTPALLARLVKLLEGWRSDDGIHHKGVIDRLEVIEALEATREKSRADREAQRRIVLVGVGLASVGAFITQVTNWFNVHLK